MPRIKKLKLKNKKAAKEKLLINSLNLSATYNDSSYMSCIENSSGNEALISFTTFSALTT